MDTRRRKTTAFLLTLLTCGIILFILLFMFAFKTPLPLPEEEGVVIETNAGGGGGSEDFYEEEFSESVSEENISSENFVTQDVEEVNYTANKLNDSKVEKVETPAKPTVDNRLTNFQWGKGNNKGSGGGTGMGTGSGSGIGSGDGSGVGSGSGAGYSLRGRGAKSIPKPNYTEDDQGKVVVTIWVNREGVVTRAEPGAIGTTVSNPSLWTAAKNAALSARFSTSSDAPEVQKGTITYTFIKGN